MKNRFIYWSLGILGFAFMMYSLFFGGMIMKEELTKITEILFATGFLLLFIWMFYTFKFSGLMLLFIFFGFGIFTSKNEMGTIITIFYLITGATLFTLYLREKKTRSTHLGGEEEETS